MWCGNRSKSERVAGFVSDAGRFVRDHSGPGAVDDPVGALVPGAECTNGSTAAGGAPLRLAGAAAWGMARVVPGLRQ